MGTGLLWLIFCSAQTGFCAHVHSVLERRQEGGAGKSLRAQGGPRWFDQFRQKCARKGFGQHRAKVKN
jgi:hypothetical protein